MSLRGPASVRCFSPSRTQNLNRPTDALQARARRGPTTWLGNRYGDAATHMLYTWTRKGEAVQEPLALPTAAAQVALGNSHGAALTTGGELFTFGGNEFGELGRPEALDSALPGPVSFPTMSRVVSVACGFFHTAAVTDDGSVWTFGWGRWGQLGQPAEADVYSARPVRVDQLAPRHAVSVACGHHSTIALDSQGEVLAWGLWRGAAPAALEDGPPTHSQSTSRVERLPLPGPACAVHAGGAHAVAVLAEHTLWAWGSNSHGQLGVGDTVDRHVPACAHTLQLVRSAGCGEEHTAAIAGGEIASSASGAASIWTWGRCEYGRGHGHQHTPQPLRVPAAERTPLAIACGFHHCACVFSSGEVLSWSAHALGGQPTLQLHAPPAGCAFTQLACGGSRTAAIALPREGGAAGVRAGLQPPPAHDAKRHTPPSGGRSLSEHQPRATPPSPRLAPSTSYAAPRSYATDACKGSPPSGQASGVEGSDGAQMRIGAPPLSTPPPGGCTASVTASLSAGPRTPPIAPAHPLHTPPHTLLEPRLPSRRSVVPPPLDAWREGSTQSAGPGGNAHRLHEGLHGELQEELQREAGRRADAEERARGERRRAELAEDAAAAAEAQAREAVLEAAATRQAMAEAEAEQRRAMAEAEAERGRAAQLQQALQTSRAEAARLRVQLHQARRAAAQQPPTAAGRHAGGAGSTGGVGSGAAPQGWMASQARLRSEGQSRELAQLTRQMRQRALRHALRVLIHWPGQAWG